MKNTNWTEEIHTCYVAGKKYNYIYPNPKYNENGKTYSEVATVWLEGDREHSFTVPFYTKYDEIYKSPEVIEKGIKKYLDTND